MKKIGVAALAGLLLFAAGCQGADNTTEETTVEVDTSAMEMEVDTGDSTVTVKGVKVQPSESSEEEVVSETVEPIAEEEELTVEETPTETVIGEAAQKEADTESVENRGLIVIDPGHQAQGNSEQEPLYPDGISSETKAKVSSGTASVNNGYNEYELNLEVSLKLRDELESRGYDVIMTRETNDVDISNAERATIANEANADAFVRIHANGGDSSQNGALTICQTSDNPANADLYEESYALSVDVLDAVVEATGANREYVWETDSMTGINWTRVPSTIVEMGYMSNYEEDLKLQDPDYQAKMVQGIANGIDKFMEDWHS
ncbi:MAG: N-acetylmuramoyl-L-alanine amidase [Lachnospiraceae bacterium]|nr:N-acetylmuramoyl-L-alanine amidase [Lachnospiraceae bacterium]